MSNMMTKCTAPVRWDASSAGPPHRYKQRDLAVGPTLGLPSWYPTCQNFPARCVPNKSVKPMLCLLPALASLLPSARLASPHVSTRAAVRMAEPVESDAILKDVLRKMPLEWGESFEARMERAQAAAVAKGGGPYAAYTKPAFLTKFTRPVLAKDPEGYKQGYEPGTSPAATAAPAASAGAAGAMDVPAACAFFAKAAAAGLTTEDAAAFLVSKEVPSFVIAESLCVAETMDPKFGAVQGHP